MDENDGVRLELGLGLGLTAYTPKKRDNPQKNKRVFFLDLSIPLHASDHGTSADHSSSSLKIMGKDEKQGSGNSFSNGSKEDDDSNCSMDFRRKKLRLTRDQTTLLEDSFKQHTTLNTAQKQALAEKLNLKTRQVEVWFQNRRARTKLKQTEVDCEFLKKNCERLSEENWRLKKELLELRSSLKTEKPQPPPPPAAATQPLRPPFFHHNPKAAAAAREKNGKDRGGVEKQEAAVMEVVHEP
ncbi:hypothetical protein Pfo_000852 [Paulownia fortunei]|nr:hypothetical protein Pfo_000852 [Paulownia fortunei]